MSSAPSRPVDVRGPRFAAGVPAVVLAAPRRFALGAALLDAATGFCRGRELYLSARRALPARA
jgi:hypothetical protein